MLEALQPENLPQLFSLAYTMENFQRASFFSTQRRVLGSIWLKRGGGCAFRANGVFSRWFDFGNHQRDVIFLRIRPEKIAQGAFDL